MHSVIFPESFSDTGHCVIGGGVNYSTNTFVCELESKKHNPDEGLESVTAHPGAAGVQQLGFIRNTGCSIHQRHKSKTKKTKKKNPIPCMRTEISWNTMNYISVNHLLFKNNSEFVTPTHACTL